jgi:hypothetical protein
LSNAEHPADTKGGGCRTASYGEALLLLSGTVEKTKWMNTHYLFYVAGRGSITIASIDGSKGTDGHIPIG